MNSKRMKTIDTGINAITLAALVYGTYSGNETMKALAVNAIWTITTVFGLALSVIALLATYINSNGGNFLDAWGEGLGKVGDAKGLATLAAYLCALSYAGEITLAGAVLAVYCARYVMHCTFDRHEGSQ